MIGMGGEVQRSFWRFGFCVPLSVLLNVAGTMPSAHALHEDPHDSWVGEGIHEFQDGTVAAVQLAEMLGRKVFSLGPMLEYASTTDLEGFGLSRKAKYWVGLRLPKFASQLDLHTNFGFMSDELVKTDSRWVVPLGAGLNFRLAGRTSLTITGLLNVAPFRSGSGDVLFPGITFGLRF
jgi:hypothetical protein